MREGDGGKMPLPGEVMFRHALALSAPLCALLAAIAVATNPAAAAIILTDGNSTATIDLASPAGLQSWLVDTTQTTKQRWYWYRVGPSGGEHSIDGLALLASNTSITGGGTTADTLYAKYSGTGFTIDITWMLRGGTAGSQTSDIAEIIRVSNTSGSALDYHLYEFTDLDLNGIGANTVSISGGNTATQTGGPWTAQTVYTGAPTHHQAGLATDSTPILTSLSDGSPTVLSDANGPVTGNAQWAMQWDRTIASGGSLLVSTDTNIVQELPEPATLLLTAGGLAVSAMLRRRRRDAR